MGFYSGVELQKLLISSVRLFVNKGKEAFESVSVVLQSGLIGYQLQVFKGRVANFFEN